MTNFIVYWFFVVVVVFCNPFRILNTSWWDPTIPGLNPRRHRQPYYISLTVFLFGRRIFYSPFNLIRTGFPDKVSRSLSLSGLMMLIVTSCGELRSTTVKDYWHKSFQNMHLLPCRTTLMYEQRSSQVE